MNIIYLFFDLLLIYNNVYNYNTNNVILFRRILRDIILKGNNNFFFNIYFFDI